MIKKIISTLILLTLVGCSCQPVKVPVWTPPTITMPAKPTLISDGKGTQGEVARKMSVDLVQMREYTMKLENILRTITNATDSKINK